MLYLRRTINLRSRPLEVTLHFCTSRVKSTGASKGSSEKIRTIRRSCIGSATRSSCPSNIWCCSFISVSHKLRGPTGAWTSSISNKMGRTSKSSSSPTSMRIIATTNSKTTRAWTGPNSRGGSRFPFRSYVYSPWWPSSPCETSIATKTRAPWFLGGSKEFSY